MEGLSRTVIPRTPQVLRPGYRRSIIGVLVKGVNDFSEAFGNKLDCFVGVIRLFSILYNFDLDKDIIALNFDRALADFRKGFLEVFFIDFLTGFLEVFLDFILRDFRTGFIGVFFKDFRTVFIGVFFKDFLTGFLEVFLKDFFTVFLEVFLTFRDLMTGILLL
jgi:hypothetical protein